jgi:hypothetical protein
LQCPVKEKKKRKKCVNRVSENILYCKHFKLEFKNINKMISRSKNDTSTWKKKEILLILKSSTQTKNVKKHADCRGSREN